MELTFKGFGIISTIYLAPTISPQGWITAWKNRHSSWKHGFVARFLWLGFVLRWGKKRPALFRYTRQIETMIQQANDGDYLYELAMAEEPH